MIYINDCLLAVFGILEVIFPGDRAAGKENAHCLYFRTGLYYSPAYPATDRQGVLFYFADGLSGFWRTLRIKPFSPA